MSEFTTTFDTANNYTTGSSVLISASEAQLSSSIESETGYSCYFNGIDNKIEVPHIAGSVWNWDDADKRTIEFWFKPLTPTGSDGGNDLCVHKLDGSWNGWGFFYDRNPGEIGFLCYSGNNELSSLYLSCSLNYGEWNHVAITCEVDKQEIFGNGTKGQSKTHTMPMDHWCIDTPLRFSTNPGATSFYTSSFSQFRLSDKILYTTDFTPSGTFANESNTLALYKMNEGSGTNIADSASAGNDGTFTNPSWSLTDTNPGKTGGDDTTVYNTASIFVYKTSGNSDSELISFTSFTVKTGSKNAGTPKFQLSNDGNTWSYYTSSAWTSASINQNDEEFNTEADINTNISNFPTGSIYVRSYLLSDTSHQTSIDKITIGYTIPISGSGKNYYVKNLILGHL